MEKRWRIAATFSGVACPSDMRRRLKWLIPALGLLLVLAAWARPRFKTLTVDGIQRRYLVSVPKGEQRMPVLLVLHGGGGRARGTSRAGFSRLSRERGFLVVYPDAIERHWNDGRQDTEASWEGGPPDDVKFLDALLDQLAKDYPVDSQRIYVTGISNGAMMSHLLALKLSHRIAAIAPIVGGIPLSCAEEFPPEHPVSVLVIQGTEDPLVPYQGGQVMVFGRARGEILSTEKAVSLWSDHNRCKDGQTESLEDKVSDRCSVERTVFGGGRQGTEVVLYKIIGGGHTVPGGRQYLPKRVIGEMCDDINAVDVIGEFFSRHSRS